MNKRVVVIFIVFSLVGSILAADERSAWTGLWRLDQQTVHGPVALHFHVPAGKAPITFYGAGWEELSLSEWTLEGSRFVLSWQAKGANVVFDGRRTGERISGNWQLVHPQYSDKGKFSAQRLFPNPRWSPLDAVKSVGSSSRLIDLNGHMADKLSSEADFGGFWQNSFRPDFYIFLAHAPAASEVQRILKRPDFIEKNKAFASQLKELADAARLKLSGLRLSITVVALPFGEAEPEVAWADNTPYLLVNVDRFAQQIPAPRRRAYFAEKILEANLQFILPNSPGDPYELWSLGVPAYLTAKSEFAALHEVLAVTSDELKALKSELPGLKEKYLAGKKLSPRERKFLAYDFAASVGGEKPASELTEMRGPDIAKAFRNYMQ